MTGIFKSVRFRFRNPPSRPHPNPTAMKATALVCTQDQRFALLPVSLPDPGPGEVSIRTLFSGVSVGTEFALVRNKISWGPFPIVTGYMGAGVVERVGEGVSGFAPGDTVYYRGSKNMALDDGTAVSAVSGVHCTHAVTAVGGTHGIAKVPDGVDPAVAATFVMPAVALHGVDKSGARVGQVALVHGCGPIGLGVVAMLAQRGCVVVAADLDASRLAMARSFGAAATLAGGEGLADRARPFFPEGAEGFDLVFECTGLWPCVRPAMELCRVHGTFVWQGNYGAAPYPFEFLVPHNRQLEMKFPCDDGYAPCRAAVLRQIAAGLLPWERAISHRLAAAEAPDFFDRVNRGAVPGLVSAVVDWRAAE